jgi:hypothetical protein
VRPWRAHQQGRLVLRPERWAKTQTYHYEHWLINQRVSL